MNVRIAAVAIGRNEGGRLKRCLTSLQAQVGRIVYVDSGSSDGSVAFAHSIGAEVVELDMSDPFTAARARNAGFDALRAGGLPDIVQFVDGDCGVQPGWIKAGMQALDSEPEIGMVTGWRSEIAPEASLYNAQCQMEWRRPAGLIEACGGDMMVRSVAWDQIKGMNPNVIAAEDDEFCVRLRKAGWQMRRIPVEMTLHDAAMTRFSEWWKRAERSGHGFAQVGHLHRSYFVRERRRVWVWGLLMPLLFLAGLIWAKWLAALVVLAYAASWLRSSQHVMRLGHSAGVALKHGAFLTLWKIPNLIGMLRFHLRRLRHQDMHIIEYK